jgi:class 3 adenylate cyclase
LTEVDLEKLGLSLGARKRVLNAISDLGGANKTPRAKALAGVASADDAAERRQLTVMFCDLAGSTALSARLDPEDMRQVIRAYQDACSGVVARYGGYVAKFMGDGILAYFGFQRAIEIAKKFNLPPQLSVATFMSGWASACGDNSADGRQVMELEFARVSALGPNPLYYAGLMASVWLEDG